MEDRYTYHIHPHKTITNVLPGKGIRRPMGLKLTKEEVLKCLACGPVYRVFPSIPPIRVTGSNLDELHVSIDEYLKKEDKKASTANHTETVVEEPVLESEVPETPENDTLTEEIVEETPVVEAEEVQDAVKKFEEMKAKEVVFKGPIEEETEEEPVPIPLEPGPAIVEEIEESVEDAEEEIEEEVEEEEDEDEEEVEETSIAPVTDQNGHIISAHPQYRKKKKKH